METLMQGFHSKNIEIDEIWCYIAKKEKRLTTDEKLKGVTGGQYGFVAFEADSKLVPTFAIGRCNVQTTLIFISQLA
jgi:hypothetical protein